MRRRRKFVTENTEFSSTAMLDLTHSSCFISSICYEKINFFFTIKAWIMCTVEAGIHWELKFCWINFINKVKSYGFFFYKYVIFSDNDNLRWKNHDSKDHKFYSFEYWLRGILYLELSFLYYISENDCRSKILKERLCDGIYFGIGFNNCKIQYNSNDNPRYIKLFSRTTFSIVWLARFPFHVTFSEHKNISFGKYM